MQLNKLKIFFIFINTLLYSGPSLLSTSQISTPLY
jgi:hypothetical protein